MSNLALKRNEKSNQDKKFRVGIYVRNSDEKQDKEEGTIKNQRLRLLEWVDTRNKNRFDHFIGEVVEVYEERSLSAKDMNRPTLKRLLRDVQKGKINLILVNELSRISRNTKDFNEIWDFLKSHGCKFVSLREDFDTSSAAGEMMLLMLANFAQFERRQTQERVTLSHLSRAKRGLFCGGTVPMGYGIIEDRPGYLKVIPEQAKIVKKAFEAFLKRETLSGAAKLLNGDGDDSKAIKIVRTMQGGGRWARLKYWNVTNLQHILRNTAYKGLRAYKENGETKYVKAAWDAIIDDATFDKVQKILDKNHSKKKPMHENRVWPYLLTGLTYCQTCGDVMCGKSAHGRSRKYPYYEHSWASKRGSTHIKELYKCDPHRVSAKKVEDAVMQKVEELLKNKKVAEALITEAREIYKKQGEKSEARELKRKIAGFKSRIEGLVERISDLPADIPADKFYDKMRKLKSEQEKSELELKEAIKLQSSADELPVSLQSYKEYLELIKIVFGEVCEIDSEWKKKLINRLVHRVEIGKDNLKIYFYAGEDVVSTGIKYLKENSKMCNNINGLDAELKRRPLAKSKSSRDFFSRDGSQTLTSGAHGGT